GVLIVAVAAQAINGALFWNFGLLFAVGRARMVAALAVFMMAVQIAALVPLAATLGAQGAALALLISTVAYNAVLTVAGVRALRRPGPRQVPTKRELAGPAAPITSAREPV